MFSSAALSSLDTCKRLKTTGNCAAKPSLPSLEALFALDHRHCRLKDGIALVGHNRGNIAVRFPPKATPATRGIGF